MDRPCSRSYNFAGEMIMDIEDAKKVKKNLENDMADLIIRFERETGLSVLSIDLTREKVYATFRKEVAMLLVQTEVYL